MEKWEYCFVMLSKHIVKEINGKPATASQSLPDYEFSKKMGEIGWELVTVLGDYSPSYLVFKRPMSLQ